MYSSVIEINSESRIIQSIFIEKSQYLTYTQYIFLIKIILLVAVKINTTNLDIFLGAKK